MPEHYDELAGAYEQAWFYQSGTAYQGWLLEQVAARLALAPHHRFADLGCGSGNFTAALVARGGLTAPATGVDACAALLAQARERGLRTVESSIEGFAEDAAERYDRLLLKEVVHHLEPGALPAIFAGLFRRLRPGGRVLLVTRPQQVAYPFFAAALALWPQQQPAPELFVDALRRAGFTTGVESAEYPAEVDAERWFGMIRGRFWSTFSAFDDATLEAGIAELRARYAGQERIAFRDRLIFVWGEVNRR